MIILLHFMFILLYFIIILSYFIIILYYFRADYHNSLQSLQLAYTRCVVLYLSINFIKFEYWRNYIDKRWQQLYHQINEIINNVNNLEYIKQKTKNDLVPQIKFNRDEMYKYTLKNIQKDKLKFRYKWNAFTTSETMQLLEWLFQQGEDDFILNQHKLNDLFNYFEQRFSTECLRKKCLKFGIEYVFESNDKK